MFLFVAFLGRRQRVAGRKRMKRMTSIRWRELEPRDGQDNCVAIGTWQGHAFANLRLSDGSWVSVHLDENGAVTEIQKSPSGKRVHKELLAYKRRLELAE